MHERKQTMYRIATQERTQSMYRIATQERTQNMPRIMWGVVALHGYIYYNKKKDS